MYFSKSECITIPILEHLCSSYGLGSPSEVTRISIINIDFRDAGAAIDRTAWLQPPLWSSFVACTTTSASNQWIPEVSREAYSEQYWHLLQVKVPNDSNPSKVRKATQGRQISHSFPIIRRVRAHTVLASASSLIQAMRQCAQTAPVNYWVTKGDVDQKSNWYHTMPRI